MNLFNSNNSIFKKLEKRPVSASKNTSPKKKLNPFKKDSVSFAELFPTRASQKSVPQIGSSFPKSTTHSNNTYKLIRPPTELVPDSILKAARIIDEQTASISWNELDATLKISKKNISRLKEMYLPLKDAKFSCENFEKKNKAERPTSFLNSHRNSIKEEIKYIFNIPDNSLSSGVQTEEFTKTEKNMSLLDYIAKAKTASPSKKNNDFTKSMQIKKFASTSPEKKSRNPKKSKKQETSKKTSPGIAESHFPNKMPTRLLVKINTKFPQESDELAVENYPKEFKPYPDEGRSAPFGVTLKGNKVKSRYGAMFTPEATASLTPNHFMNFNTN